MEQESSGHPAAVSGKVIIKRLLQPIVPYAFSLLSSTLGVWFSLGAVVNTVLRPIMGKEAAYELALKPYYPLLIGFGLLTGYLAHIKWSKLCTPWVWILPGAYVCFTVLSWMHSGYGLQDTLTHFFSKTCWPSCQDQYSVTWPLYSSAAFSLGVVLHRAHISSEKNIPE